MYVLITLWQWREAAAGESACSMRHPAESLISSWPGLIEEFWTYEHGNEKSFGLIVLDSADNALDLKNALERFESPSAEHVRLEMSRVHQLVGRRTTQSLSST